MKKGVKSKLYQINVIFLNSSTKLLFFISQVPENEGKAGMAAIVDPNSKIDFESLAAGIKGSLPPYARPVFLRIMPELPMTGTFKLKKRDLQLEGYDITKITDPIYLLQSDGSYKKLTMEKYEEIKSRGKLWFIASWGFFLVVDLVSMIFEIEQSFDESKIKINGIFGDERSSCLFGCCWDK